MQPSLWVPVKLETERLLLRPAQEVDADSIFERYAQDPEVTRFLIWKPHRSVTETHEFIQRCQRVWTEETAYPWVITHKSDHLLLGMIELRPDGHKAELGYVLARDAWGHGYMTEAIRTVVAWALAAGTSGSQQIWRLWAYCHVQNTASARVLEKAGLRREGILKRWAIHPAFGAEPQDCFSYAIVRDAAQK